MTYPNVRRAISNGINYFFSFFLFSCSYPILLMFSSITVSFLCGHYFYHIQFWVKSHKLKAYVYILSKSRFPLCELFFILVIFLINYFII